MEEPDAPEYILITSHYKDNAGKLESFLVLDGGVEYIHPMQKNVRLQWTDILLANYLLSTKTEHYWQSWQSLHTYEDPDNDWILAVDERIGFLVPEIHDLAEEVRAYLSPRLTCHGTSGSNTT